MGPNTKGLSRPKPSFSAYKLPVIATDPGKFYRISKHRTGEPFFNNSGKSRFDDPYRKYKTCYFGFKLVTAIAESVLHDVDPVDGHFDIALAKLDIYNVYRYSGERLRLANLTGEDLKRIGGHAQLSGTSYYHTPQKWSAAVYSHPSNVDGFIYMSRHVNTEKAVVLFDRAEQKIKAQAPEQLVSHVGWPRAAKRLGIRGIWP